MGQAVTVDRVRRAEVLAALSLAIDLGLGQPMDHMLAVRDDRHQPRPAPGPVRGAAGGSPTTQRCWPGSAVHADSHELSAWFGDDIAFRADTYDVTGPGCRSPGCWPATVGRDRPALARAGRAAALFGRLRGNLRELMSSHCLSGRRDSPNGPGSATTSVARWRTRSSDGTAAGCRPASAARTFRWRCTSPTSRDVAEVHLRRAGVEHRRTARCARAAARSSTPRSRRRSPPAADRNRRRAGGRRRVAGGAGPGARPGSYRSRGDDLDRLFTAVATSPILQMPPRCSATSRAVAALAADAARRYGLPDPQVRVCARGRVMHDIGRMGVPNSIWEKRGRPSDTEWERVRLYPYLTGRILSRIDGFRRNRSRSGRAPRAGWTDPATRGPRGAALVPRHSACSPPPTLSARCAKSGRTGRAHDRIRGAQLLREKCAPAGWTVPRSRRCWRRPASRCARRRTWPAGLTEREVDVLRLVARGESNGAIAAALRISEKTVRNHVEHIYTKIDVNNRTGASLFATGHGIAEDPHRQLPET
jgi:DNA-binding CsgD family transcriptional regulator